MDEFRASLALRHTKGLGPRTWKRLLDAFGSADRAVAAFPAWKGLVSSRVMDAFRSRAWEDKADAEAARAERLQLSILPWSDAGYPELLRHIPDPPLFLYYLGDVTLLNRPGVALVGSRQCSRYGTGMADSIAATLSRAGVCVVSGFAFGIDRAAHVGALRGVGSTIAVLGTGLDLIYPASNADLWSEIASKGLILTEFSPGTKPEGPNFPHRNRIVSGLSLGVLVVEAALGSGSLITASLALAQNREVFALPGPANLKTFQGCHQLIRQGACLVQDGEDILRELDARLRPFALSGEQPVAPVLVPTEATRPGAVAPTPVLPDDPDQRTVARLLAGRPRAHVDVLTRELDWPSEKVSSTLLLLELQGLVEQLPGMYYALSRT